MKRTLPAFLLGLLLAPALGAQPHLRLTLDESEQAAVAASQTLQAARLDAAAAKQREQTASAYLLPRLSLDGNYRYVAEVPSVQLSPKAPAIPFGDNNNYSLGLTATWDIFGGLGTWRLWQMATEQRKAKEAEALYQEQALRLRTRLAYFQTQLVATQVRLYADALNLAQSQDNDLALRLKAGTSSRIDALSASNEELERRAAFRIAQGDLAASLRELFALTGLHKDADVSNPVEEAVGQSLPAKVQAPTVAVVLDPSDSLLGRLAPAEKAAFDPSVNPRLRALLAQVEAARRGADAAFAGHYPKGSISGRWSEDYPNGPILETVDQKSFSANLSVPLYSFGAVSGQVDEQVDLANAAQARSVAATTDLERDWLKSHDRLAALKAQREIQAQAAQQSSDLQQLVYKAYKVGGSTFLEVQNSSVRSLQAGLALAITETQILIELADLAALTESAR